MVGSSDRTKFWSTAADFLNRASATGIHGDRAAEGRPIAGECEEEGKSLAPSLWEDRSLAGFMPIKGSLSTMDTFALPDLKRMSTKVIVIVIVIVIAPRLASRTRLFTIL